MNGYLEDYSGPNSSFMLSSVEVEIELADLYETVEFNEV